MSAKAPYYYSELRGKQVSVADEEQKQDGTNNEEQSQRDQSPGTELAEDSGTQGFYNPLLSIEPDISTEEFRLPKTSPKKKKKKKKKIYSSPFKQSNLSMQNGASSKADSKSISLRRKMPSPENAYDSHNDQRRNSEPNLYEEIPENITKEEPVYSTGSLAGFFFSQRRRPNSSQYASSGRLSETVLSEVNEVQQKHALILENLNLDFETMLMPECSVSNPPTVPVAQSPARQLGKLLLGKKQAPVATPSKAGTAESLMAQYEHSKIYAQRRGNEYILSQSDLWNLNTSTPSKNIYCQQRYPKGVLSASESLGSLRRSSEPLYMLYDDSHRLQRLCCRETDDNIYEEVDHLQEKLSSNGGPPGSGVPGEEHHMSSWGVSNWGGPITNPYALENNLGHSDGSEEEGGDGQAAGALASRIVGKAKKRPKKKDSDASIASGFTRWFSTRRKEYELEKVNKMNIKPLTEDGYVDVKLSKKQRPPLTLPPVRPGLTNEQMKRRYIVQSIVDSENSYVNSLQRLIKDYKRPLEESQPPVISPTKISTMFYRVEQILQCHNMFGIALTQCVREWDLSEKIGDVFVASFSKAIVLDIYSDFINNFSTAMETAKLSSKNKSAFADFLKVKQITSPDRLSFFGLMVKPVQRFPQFILLLQDLLKHTPQGHHDRISLQLALTQLELLADTLNERKRESEQLHSVKEVLKHLGNKFSFRGILAEGTPGPSHFLLRQDNVIQLDMDQNGMVIKSRNRRLYLLNDLLVCMSVSPRSSENMNGGERFSLKWAVPLQEVEVQEDVAPATRNLLASSGRYKNVVNRNSERHAESSLAVQALYDDLSDLIHDLEVMSRIAALIGSLRRTYTGLNVEMLQGFSQGIQEAIRKKDEEITLLDSCCLQLILPAKSKSNKEILCFQLMSPGIKLDWITDLRLAKLAMDPNNTPAWDIKEQEKRPSFRMPLFEKTLPAFTGTTDTEVNCGCYYAVYPSDGSGRSCQNFLCLATVEGQNSHIHVMQVGRQGSQVRKVGTFSVSETRVLSMEAVPSYYVEAGLTTEMAAENNAIVPGVGETLWVGTDSRRIVVVNGRQPEEWQEVGALTVAAPVLHLKYHCQHVFAALSNGTVLIFDRGTDCVWQIQTPQIVTLGTDPVTCLLPLGQALYCACSTKIWVIHAPTQEVQRSYTLQHCSEREEVNLLAHSGTGLWISLRCSPTICLYHTETFHHLQDINVAPCIQRLLSVHYPEEQIPENIHVTSLMATRGLLWVGTNMGVVVTIPLPRLEGVPILSGRSNVAYHAHTGPVTLLLSLQARQPPHPLLIQQPAETQDATTAPSEDGSSGAGGERPTEEEGTDGLESREQRDEEADEIDESLEVGIGPATGVTKGGAPLPPDACPPLDSTQTRVLKQKSDSLLPSAWLGRKIMGMPGKCSMSELHSSGAKTLPRKMMLCRQALPACPPTQQTLPHPGAAAARAAHMQRQISLLSEDANNVYGLYADLMNVQDYERDSQEKLYERLNHSDPELVHFKLNTLDRRLQQKMGRPRSWDLSTMAVSEDSDSSAACDASSVSTMPCCELQQQSPLVSQIHNHQGPHQGPLGPPVGAPVKNPRVLPRSMHPKHIVDYSQKTLLILTGGSGYINWRMADKDPQMGKQEAQVILWEMKL